MKFGGLKRNWAVYAEDCQLDFLSRLRIARKDHSVRSVEALDHRPAGLPEDTRHFAVYPDFGVVIDDDFECDR